MKKQHSTIDRRRGRTVLFACLGFIGLPLLAFLAWMEFSPCPHPLEGLTYSRCVLDRDGRLLRLGLTSDDKYRVRTELRDIPREAVDAVIRYEDRYFWRHPGVNVPALLRSGATMLAGGRVMGGSTITMQVVRLSMKLKTGSLGDKIIQTACALRLERHLTKSEILEAYFNLAPYGANIEGLGAAARIFFHKPASRLLPSENLALMLVPQNPAMRFPSEKNPRFRRAYERIRAEWLGETEHAPLRIHTLAELPFACPHLSQEVLACPASYPETSTTAIDSRLQARIEHQLRRFAETMGPLGLRNAAAMLVHWPTHEIRALAGSADFMDATISGQIDGTLARRSPGSTLKPAIYGLALDQGLIHPRTLLMDMPRSFSGYDPENFDSRFRGPLPAEEALRLSRNVPAITLTAKLNNPDLYTFLTRAGVRFRESADHYGLALVLGGAEVTMRELAALYCLFPNRGVWRPLRVLKNGRKEDTALQLLSPEAAFVTMEMLVSPVPGHTLPGKNGQKLPLRVKTGTSNGFRDAWTAGIFGPYVLVVWAGNFDNTPHPLLVGGKTALPLFLDCARSIAALEPLSDRLGIPSPGLNVEKLPVCAATGDLDTSLCPGRTADCWFIPGVSPVKPTGILRKIAVNRETGLRSCHPESEPVEELVWEFWPSELEQQFMRAGIVKRPPPPFAPECGNEAARQDTPPTIVLPKAGLTYYLRLGTGTSRTQPLALMAHAAQGARAIYWFAAGKFLGTSSPGQTLLHEFEPGDYRIRAVDSTGAASTRMLHVRAAK